ncbi:MAG: nitroreductase/quinone reductase family protein [Acidimicrobiia bacterium]|nr:nitroreductase/quinone reductase family protein [Acidimicrobiia bacterium]
MIDEALEQEQFAYLTTRGRTSGRPHRIEIWFVVIEGAVWVASGGGDRADWIRNLVMDRSLVLEIGSDSWQASATVHTSLHEHPARQRLASRYQGWKPGEPLSNWATSSLLVEIVAKP